MSKKVLAVDNDDVLFGLVEAIFAYYNSLYKTDFKLKDQIVFNLDATFQLSEAETIDLIYRFYRSRYLLNTKPIPGALANLKKLKQQYDLVLITARPTFTKSVTLRALKEHFPDIFSEVYLTNAFSKSGRKKLKSEVCLEVGARLMIDDAMHNAEDCADKGIPVILFRRPWNQTLTKADLKGKPIYPAKNWTEIGEMIPKILK